MNLCLDGPTAPIDLLLRIMENIIGGTCCIGAAEYGFDRCTCWEPVYDLEQQPPIAVGAGNVETRGEMCADCAFRPDSPERQGDARYSHAGEEFEHLTHFWCHQGMRKPIGYQHPAGIYITADTDAYKPPLVLVDGERVPFKADGTPGDRCAGFAAWQRHRKEAPANV
jgi:hypothetical protein